MVIFMVKSSATKKGSRDPRDPRVDLDVSLGDLHGETW